MDVTFYLAAAIAVVSTFMMVTRLNAVHALLYLIVSFLSVSVVFYTIGAPFIAALEVIIYAGAIMVLFLFVIMLLGAESLPRAEVLPWQRPFAILLSILLMGEAAYLLITRARPAGDVLQPAGDLLLHERGQIARRSQIARRF